MSPLQHLSAPSSGELRSRRQVRPAGPQKCVCLVALKNFQLPGKHSGLLHYIRAGTNQTRQQTCCTRQGTGQRAPRAARGIGGSGSAKAAAVTPGSAARGEEPSAERLVPVPDNTTSTLLELFRVRASLPRGAQPRQADASHNSQSCGRTVPKSTWGSLLSLPPAQGDHGEAQQRTGRSAEWEKRPGDKLLTIF